MRTVHGRFLPVKDNGVAKRKRSARLRREGETAEQYLKRMVALELRMARQRAKRAKENAAFESALGRRKRMSESKLSTKSLRALADRQELNDRDQWRIQQLETLSELSDGYDSSYSDTISGIEAEIKQRNETALSHKLSKSLTEEEGGVPQKATMRGLEGVGEGFLIPLLAPPPLDNPPQAKMAVKASEILWNPIPLPSKIPNKNPSGVKIRARTRAREESDPELSSLSEPFLKRQPGQGRPLLAVEQWVYEQDTLQRPDQPWPMQLALVVLAAAVLVRRAQTCGHRLRLPRELLDLTPATELPELLYASYQRAADGAGKLTLGNERCAAVAVVEISFRNRIERERRVSFPVALQAARDVLVGELVQARYVPTTLWRNRGDVCQKLVTEVLSAYLRGGLELVGNDDVKR